MKKKLLAGLFIVAVAAQCNATTPSYNFVQGSVVKVEFADLQPFELKGYELRGSYEFYDNFFAELSYIDADDSISDNDFGMQNWQVEAGYIYSYSTATTMDIKLGYGKIDFDFRDNNESFKGGTYFYSLSSNVKYMLTQEIELGAGLEIQYWDEGSNQKAYNLRAQYHFDSFSVGAEYTKYSDSEVVALTARYSY